MGLPFFLSNSFWRNFKTAQPFHSPPPIEFIWLSLSWWSHDSPIILTGKDFLIFFAKLWVSSSSKRLSSSSLTSSLPTEKSDSLSSSNWPYLYKFSLGAIFFEQNLRYFFDEIGDGHESKTTSKNQVFLDSGVCPQDLSQIVKNFLKIRYIQFFQKFFLV